MQKTTINEFSGGIQEAYSPEDFSKRQWARLKGVVPNSATEFRSQWSCQRVGLAYDSWLEDGGTGTPDTSKVIAVFPLESMAGVFLVAIKASGTVWWAKASDSEATYTTTNGLLWRKIKTAENRGIKATISGSPPVRTPDDDAADQPSISLFPNPDFRFITGLPFEVYKYITQPLDGRASDFRQDRIFVSGTIPPRSQASGVLIHSRRYLNTVSGDYEMYSDAHTQAVVAYVDPRSNSGAGAVKAVTFPNFRRWPTVKQLSGWSQITVGGVTYGAEDKYDAMKPFTTADIIPNGADGLFLDEYPFVGGGTGDPKLYNEHHPYTYLDANSTLLPGRGLVPRANVGTMWGNQLILGDIEWQSNEAFTAKSNPKTSISANRAYLPFNDARTEPHRGSFYYSEDDIDVFDPRSVLRASGTDTRIAGMHVINNRLICITTTGGPSDGVIAFSGNLGQLHPYSSATVANPFAIRKQIVRGGVGVADYDDIQNYGPTLEGNDNRGHVSQTCLWPDAGSVVFVDKAGGIYATDGESCSRIDAYGPRQPSTSTFRDHVAAVGKHLVAWRDKRLLVLTIMEATASTGSACWTELVLPESVTYASDLRSMVGINRELYMVLNGNVWRYALDAPSSERGKANNTALSIVVSTPTLGSVQNHTKMNWHRVGVGFYTGTSCTLENVTVRAAAALQSTSPTPNPADSQNITYVPLSSTRSFTNGYYTQEFAAGIGSQPLASATFTFTGDVTLESASFWTTGSTMKRGDV